MHAHVLSAVGLGLAHEAAGLACRGAGKVEGHDQLVAPLLVDFSPLFQQGCIHVGVHQTLDDGFGGSPGRAVVYTGRNAGKPVVVG